MAASRSAAPGVRQVNYEDQQQLLSWSCASGDRLPFAVLWTETCINPNAVSEIFLSEFYFYTALQVNSSLTHEAEG